MLERLFPGRLVSRDVSFQDVFPPCACRRCRKIPGGYVRDLAECDRQATTTSRFPPSVMRTASSAEIVSVGLKQMTRSGRPSSRYFGSSSAAVSLICTVRIVQGADDFLSYAMPGLSGEPVSVRFRDRRRRGIPLFFIAYKPSKVHTKGPSEHGGNVRKTEAVPQEQRAPGDGLRRLRPVPLSAVMLPVP